MPIARMIDVDIDTCRLLIRQDFNVPIQNGKITSDARIRAALPTINQAIARGCKIMLMSHLGRPDEGEYDSSLSLLPVARCLSQLLGQEVSLITDYLDNPPNLQQGQVVLLENIRFNVGEKGNNEMLAKQYASLCDVFVMDAFGSAHRAQASTYGVGLFAKTACAGVLLASELESLSKALDNPKRPLVAIVGGSKVSTKLTLLRNLISKVDKLIVGGGIANTFLVAKGYNIGKSLYESSLVTEAKELMQLALQQNTVIAFPTDVITAKEYAQYATAHTKRLDMLDDDDMIFDIGSDTSASYRKIINQAATIVWNGPVGVFEFNQFSHGTKNLAEAIAKSTAFSVAGGGDTLAAIDTYNIASQLSYISTGGGAFLECIEGKTLPAVAMLEQRYQT